MTLNRDSYRRDRQFYYLSKILGLPFLKIGTGENRKSEIIINVALPRIAGATKPGTMSNRLIPRTRTKTEDTKLQSYHSLKIASQMAVARIPIDFETKSKIGKISKITRENRPKLALV